MQLYFGNTGFTEYEFWEGLRFIDKKHFKCDAE